MTRWLYLSVALTIATLAGTVYLFNAHYDFFPELVPTHWDIHDQPNGWTPRSQLLPILLILPGVMMFMTALGFCLPWLSPKQFPIVDTFGSYVFIMNASILLMALIQGVILWAAVQPGLPMGRLLMGLLFLFFALIGSSLGRLRQNFYIGVRTPWTLASEPVWNQTHQLAAWMFGIGGLLGVASVLAGVPVFVSIIGLAIIALVPVLYSLVLYKRLERAGRLGP